MMVDFFSLNEETKKDVFEKLKNSNKFSDTYESFLENLIELRVRIFEPGMYNTLGIRKPNPKDPGPECMEYDYEKCYTMRMSRSLKSKREFYHDNFKLLNDYRGKRLVVYIRQENFKAQHFSRWFGFGDREVYKTYFIKMVKDN